jgi:hypothetical protein
VSTPCAVLYAMVRLKCFTLPLPPNLPPKKAQTGGKRMEFRSCPTTRVPAPPGLFPFSLCLASQSLRIFSPWLHSPFLIRS